MSEVATPTQPVESPELAAKKKAVNEVLNEFKSNNKIGKKGIATNKKPDAIPVDPPTPETPSADTSKTDPAPLENKVADTDIGKSNGQPKTEPQAKPDAKPPKETFDINNIQFNEKPADPIIEPIVEPKPADTKSEKSFADFAKELGFDGISDPNQLKEAIKNQTVSELQADQAVYKNINDIDHLEKLSDKELYKWHLQARKKMTAEQADTYIAKKEALNGEDYIETEAIELRADLANAKIQETAKIQEWQKGAEARKKTFEDTIRTAFRETRLIGGVEIAESDSMKATDNVLSGKFDRDMQDPRNLAKAAQSYYSADTMVQSAVSRVVAQANIAIAKAREEGKVEGRKEFENTHYGTFNNRQIPSENAGAGRAPQGNKEQSKEQAVADIMEQARAKNPFLKARS